MDSLDAFAGHILLLSGPPGSGKTTTAEALARLPGRTAKVHLHSDDLWGYIKHGVIAPWLPEAAEQNRMIMEIAAAVADRYARNGYLVALDGVIGPWSLPAYEMLAAPAHYLVLRTPVDEAVARCRQRGGDSLGDADVIAGLHAQFADLGEYEGHAIDTSGFTREQTLGAVIAAVTSGRYRLEIAP